MKKRTNELQNVEQEYLRMRALRDYIQGLLCGLALQRDVDLETCAQTLINEMMLSRETKFQKIALGHIHTIVQTDANVNQMTVVSIKIANAVRDYISTFEKARKKLEDEGKLF